MTKPTRLIDNWSLEYSERGQCFFLHGESREYDGSFTFRNSAKLVVIDFERKTAETENSVYRLGDMAQKELI